MERTTAASECSSEQGSTRGVGAPEPGTARRETMKAIVRDTYGSPDVLELREIPKPELTPDGVLVRVRATSVNRLEWYGVTGRPYVARIMAGLRKPKEPALGVDFAGTVEAVGRDVTDFRPGDEVFGGTSGAFAEYVCVRDAVVPKPANLTFEEAAAVPVAGITALQSTRASFSPGRRFSSTAPRAAWARLPCRSRRRSEPR